MTNNNEQTNGGRAGGEGGGEAYSFAARFSHLIIDRSSLPRRGKSWGRRSGWGVGRAGAIRNLGQTFHVLEESVHTFFPLLVLLSHMHVCPDASCARIKARSLFVLVHTRNAHGMKQQNNTGYSGSGAMAPYMTFQPDFSPGATKSKDSMVRYGMVRYGINFRDDQCVFRKSWSERDFSEKAGENRRVASGYEPSNAFMKNCDSPALC